MDIEERFLLQFEDHLAPKLDTYEQVIYLYVFRHSRLIGKDEVTQGFKSARARMACGVGEKGKPMAEHTAYEKLQSLQAKGCIKILGTERLGHRIRLFLPHEIQRGNPYYQEAEAHNRRNGLFQRSGEPTTHPSA